MFTVFIILVIVFIVFISVHSPKALGLLPSAFWTKQQIFITDKYDNRKTINTKYSSWFMPYNDKGKTNLKKITKSKSGVYFIRSKKTKEVYYIGYSSSSLYKALYRHFQYYNDEHKQERTYYADKYAYEVSVAVTTKTHAPILEKHLILEMQPRDCTLKYDTYLTEKYQETATADEEINIDDLEFYETQEEAPF